MLLMTVLVRYEPYIKGVLISLSAIIIYTAEELGSLNEVRFMNCMLELNQQSTPCHARASPRPS